MDAVARIAALDGRGAALRLPYAEFSDVDSLVREIDAGLKALSLPANDVDLFLDAESLALMPPALATLPVLMSTLLDALRTVQKHPFRNIVFVGSSVPESLGRREDAEPLTIERREFRTCGSV